MKKALITGITGQDGSFLAELLLRKGYEVHGLIRRSSTSSTTRIDHLCGDNRECGGRIILHSGDLADGASLRKVMHNVQPDEVYNLAGQSHVRTSFDQPEYTVDICGLGVLRLLNAIRECQAISGKVVKFYQASSSEIFGKVAETPQRETTPFHPRSPYACAKAYAHWQTINYREAYGLFACSGIPFNHESERRGEAFVTRKITRAATRIKMGLQKKLCLGNLEGKRDWGYAPEYVEAMWLMMQQAEAGDYVIATGESHSVRDFLDAVFGHLGLDWREWVATDPSQQRPAEVDTLVGDASKVKSKLGWKPRTSFRDLVRIMTEHDLDLARREAKSAKTFSA